MLNVSFASVCLCESELGRISGTGLGGYGSMEDERQLDPGGWSEGILVLVMNEVLTDYFSLLDSRPYQEERQVLHQVQAPM